MAVGVFWNRVTGMIAGLAIGRTASDATRPIFEVVRQEAWHANPNAIVGPQVLASLVATGVLDYDPAAEQAQREGLDSNQFRALVEYYANAPQLGMALQALQRGTITETQYLHALAKQGISSDYYDAMLDLRHTLVPQSDLVRMAVREVFNPAQRDTLDLDAEYPEAFTEPAEALGLSEAIARDYWAAHWELPSYTQATQMLFRGEIDRPKFQALLKALDYAPTWRGPLESIARAIPTMSDFIRFAQREVFSPRQRADLGLDADYPAAFTAKAALHGMSEQDARDYWAAHWRLPSARQGYTMLWRHEIEPDELDGLLKALDYPAVWRDRLASIAHLKPGRIDLKRFLRHGIFTREQVKDGYMQIGYAEPDAEHMTAVAEAEVLGTDEAQPWLNRAKSRLFTVAHNEYIDGSLDDAGARAMLELVGATAVEINSIIGLWTAENEIARAELTPAQVRKVYKAAHMTHGEAIERLLAKGYTPDDAETFLDYT